MTFMPSGVVSATENALVFELTSETFLSQSGFSRAQALGSLDPDPLFFEFGLIEKIVTFDTGSFSLEVVPDNIPDADTSWRFLTIEGTFLSGFTLNTYFRRDRTLYDPSGGIPLHTIWFFDPGQDEMLDAEVYQVKIVR